jgi:5-methylcytosine-specific restriction endonuclease McrA
MKIGRQGTLEVLGEFPLSTLLLARKGGNHKFKCGDKTYSVKMGTNRYKTFLKSMACVACGSVGKRLFLERFQQGGRTPHFNLYAVERGELVLMTKDHSVPKAMGGEDKQENLVTMCFVCNQIKGSSTFLGLDHIARAKRAIMASDGKVTIGFWLVRKDLKNGDVVASNVGMFLNHDRDRAAAKAAERLNRNDIRYYAGKNRKEFSVWPQFLLSPMTGIKQT